VAPWGSSRDHGGIDEGRRLLITVERADGPDLTRLRWRIRLLADGIPCTPSGRTMVPGLAARS
jgi:hypothetical protein